MLDRPKANRVVDAEAVLTSARKEPTNELEDAAVRD
jgi:hypothetical protein